MLYGNTIRSTSGTHNRTMNRVREITSMDRSKRKYLRNT